MNVSSGSVQAGVAASESLSLGTTTATAASNVTGTLSFGSGTGSGLADRHIEITGVVLAASATVTYTLSAMTDLLGRSVGFVKVRGLVVSVTTRTAGDFLTLGDPGATLTHPWSAPFGSAISDIKVYDVLCLGAGKTDGYPVVASTTDQILITNSGSHSITFSIAIIGTSA